MTALEPAPPADPELLARVEARQARCPRCGCEIGTDCDMTRCPPLPSAPRSYHPKRLTRARQGW